MAKNQNGKIVLQTLETLDEPSTVSKISKQIADALGADQKEVKNSVQETLEAGVRYGYVQKAHGKYYTFPVDLAETMDDDSGPKNSAELLDRTRRRRMHSRRRRRTGRRSHSRRRKSK